MAKKKSFFLSAFFQLQKTWFYGGIFAALLLFLYLFVYAFQTTIIPDPPSNEDGVLYAPFADPLAKTQTPGHNALPLDQANRSYLELENWITIMVSDSLSFDAVEYYSTLARMRREYFTPEAYDEYQETLQQFGIAKYLSQSGLLTTVLLEETPALRNEGVVNGVYKWLYDVPVTVSYSNPDADRSDLPENARAMLRIQISRVQDDDDPLALRVDEWTFTPRRGQ